MATEIWVDAGVIAIGDPCMAERPFDEVVDELNESCQIERDGFAQPYGKGQGIFVGVPDGCYPVNIVRDQWGCPVKIEILLDQD